MSAIRKKKKKRKRVVSLDESEDRFDFQPLNQNR